MALDIYIITASLFFFLSIVLWGRGTSERKKSRILFFLAVTWLIIHDGFRWEIGTDWDTYYDTFVIGEGSHFGSSYLLLNSVLHSLSGSYTIVTFTIALFTYATLRQFISKNSPAPFISLCVYYCEMLGLLGCNRQIIAMCICLLSLKFVFERALIPFLICLAIAISFHITAVVFLPAYFLYGRRYSNKLVIVVSCLAFIIGLAKLVNRLPFAPLLGALDSAIGGNNFSSYVDNYSESVSIMGSLKRLVFVFAALYARPRINSIKYDYFVLMYSISAVIFLCFNGSVLQLFAGRGAIYYSIFDVLWIPTALYGIKFTKSSKLLIWSLFFLFLLYIMNRDIMSYGLESGVDIYHPYKSVLLP